MTFDAPRGMEQQREHASVSRNLSDDRQALAEKALDDVRAILQGDGGDIVLRRISDDGRRIEVSLTGLCEACPMNEITLGGIVRSSLRRYFPLLEQVVQILAEDPA